MKRNHGFRTAIIAVLAIAMMIPLTSCAGATPTIAPTTAPTTAPAAVTATPTTAPTPTAAPATPAPAEITLMFQDHGGWAFLEDNMVNRAIKERLGITLHYNVLPVADYDTKINAVLASGQLNDITVLGLARANQYGNDYFVNLLDNKEKLPNLMKIADSNPLWAPSCSDVTGKVWGMPIIQVTLLQMGYVFRGDLMQKYNLQAPATLDDFETMLKTLKGINSEYVFGAQPNCVTLLFLFRPCFGLNPATNFNDFGDGTYVHDSTTTNLQKMIIFLNRLYTEGLLDQQFVTRTAQSWEEEVAKGNMVGFTGYAARSDSMTATTLKGTDMWLTCLPLLAGPEGKKGVAISSTVNSGYLDCVSKNSKNVDACLRYMDYLMSDDGDVLYNWGIEGQTFKVVDGKKQLIDTAMVTDFNMQSQAGIQVPMYVRRQDKDFYETYTLSNQSAKAWEMYKDNGISPIPPLAYTKEESETMAKYDIGTVYNDYVYGMITGKYDPINDWGKFQTDMSNAGLGDYMKVVNTAYARQKSK